MCGVCVNQYVFNIVINDLHNKCNVNTAKAVGSVVMAWPSLCVWPAYRKRRINQLYRLLWLIVSVLWPAIGWLIFS